MKRVLALLSKLQVKKISMILSVLFLMGISMVMAQPSGGDPGGGSDPDNPVPITGLEILLGLGGAYGAKKLIDQRKKTNSSK